MPDPRQEKLERIFHEALAIDTPPALEAYLDSACGEDPDLRKKVTELLEAQRKMGDFLETPPVEPDPVFDPEPPGTRIGRYKILQKIGEGGFGVVYMAEQEEPVNRKVALKVLKPGMDTKQVIARFEAERQALALMDHPHIAQVFDAGATGSGRPYFVMELVRGIKITRFCAERRLTWKERITLLLPVCHAVQHAHQKGIIHRDLKPGNVLVELRPEGPVPKIIDFGIAKATSRRLTDKTLYTDFHHFMGTPEYMSPDQVDAKGIEPDTRTDIYSLGVILYELLTGTTPLHAEHLREHSYEEIRRILREEDPPRPSARLAAIQAGTHTPGTREDEVGIPLHGVPARAVKGELDWIVMKAMDKDRARRYATAKDLADDLERFLRREPVLAGPPGMGYRARKFVERHRVGVLAGTIVGLALLVGLSLAVAGYLQARSAGKRMKAERDAAERARAAAQEQRTLAETRTAEARALAKKTGTVSAFLEDMLRSVDPSRALGRAVTVQYVLDEAVKRIDLGAFEGQPEGEADVRLTLGETYLALGLYERAERNLRIAEALRNRHLGAEHADTLRVHRSLAKLLRVTGRFAEAEALLRETVRVQRRVLGEEHPETLATLDELALALRGPGRFAEAEAIHRRVLEVRRRTFGMSHPETVITLGHLGADLRALGRTEEAGTLLAEALEGCNRVLEKDHPFTAEVLHELGRLREGQALLEQAETLYRRAYTLCRRVLGPDHPRTLLTLNALIRVVNREGNAGALRPLVGERLAHYARMAARPDATASELHAYAWELLHCDVPGLRDPGAALQEAERAVRLDGGKDAGLLETLASAYHDTGRLDDAVETQRRAVAAVQGGSDFHDPAKMEAKLRTYLVEKGDISGAFDVSWEGLTRELGGLLLPVPPDESLLRKSEALMAQERYGEAVETLRTCLALRRKRLPERHWRIADTLSRLGAALAGLGRFVEAEPLLLHAYEALAKDPRLSPGVLDAARTRIIDLYERWKRPEKAASWRVDDPAADGRGGEKGSGDSKNP